MDTPYNNQVLDRNRQSDLNSNGELTGGRRVSSIVRSSRVDWTTAALTRTLPA